eukprot:13151018-Ditylum_brightwellii.AAC.1
MQLLDVDIFAMPKISTPWTKQVQTTCYHYEHKICGSFKCAGTSSDETMIGIYQPGGVTIFGRGRIVGRINKVGSAKRGLGRWNFCRFNGKYNRQLWIIATYRVCNQSNKDIETTYMQQVQLLQQQGVNTPD